MTWQQAVIGWAWTGENVVRGVINVVELFRDRERDLMNQLLNGVGDIMKHENIDRIWKLLVVVGIVVVKSMDGTEKNE